MTPILTYIYESSITTENYIRKIEDNINWKWNETNENTKIKHTEHSME